MKKLILVLALVLAAGTASAQKFQLGARAGIGSQNLKMSDVWKGDAHVGWNLAAVTRFRLVGFGSGLLGAGLYLQPEVVYSQNTVKMDAAAGGGAVGGGGVVTAPESFKTRMSTVDIPLLLSAKLSIVSVQAGPVVNVMTRFDTTSGAGEAMPGRAAVGYALGAAVKLGLLTVDGRFHGDFGKLKGSVQGGGTAVDSVKSSVEGWSLGVAVMF